MASLAAWQPPPLTCQVVVRDLSSDHLLFGSRGHPQIRGLIDLHASGWDTPAADLGRLLGSWLPAGGEAAPGWWATALAACEQERPLAEQAAAIVPLLAASGILFGLDNWFRWVLVERRTFTDEARVVARVDWLLARLPRALAIIRSGQSVTGMDSGLTPEKCSS
jgi:Ser/Thr protein kinase RdoA (MazF antagonist)